MNIVSFGIMSSFIFLRAIERQTHTHTRKRWREVVKGSKRHKKKKNCVLSLTCISLYGWCFDSINPAPTQKSVHFECLKRIEFQILPEKIKNKTIKHKKNSKDQHTWTYRHVENDEQVDNFSINFIACYAFYCILCHCNFYFYIFGCYCCCRCLVSMK